MKIEKNSDSLKKLIILIRPFLWKIFLAMLLGAVYSIAVAAPAYILQRIVDDVFSDDNAHATRMLNMISIGILVIIFVRGASYFLQQMIAAKVSQQIVMDIRNKVFSNLQYLSLSFFNKNQSGQIISILLNDTQLLHGLNNMSISFVNDFLTVIILVTWVFYKDWKLSLLTFIVIPLIAIVIARFSRKMRKIGLQIQDKMGDLMSFVNEIIGGIKIIKAFTAEKKEIADFDSINKENYEVNLKATRLLASNVPKVEILNTLGMVIVLWFGGRAVIDKTLSAGELIGFLTALGMTFTPIKRMTHFNSNLQQVLASVDRIFHIIDEKPEITEIEEPLELKEHKGKLEFRDVSFKYGEQNILTKLDFVAGPDEMIAIVGPSGAGKTTLVSLIPRFYDIFEGEIVIDGVPIDKMRLNDLRKIIGIVPQETVLFSGTIRDNISYGDFDATQEEIEKAARLANAHNFIMEFENGYDTSVGEKGVLLSGGQRQRIAIARAIIKDPLILIFDEATSSLDSESEKLIQEAIENVSTRRTTIVIAHRLATVLKSDKIIVLEKGLIKEIGNHKELLEQNGLYAYLYNVQFRENE
ncbi:ABC transporter ATP-binding protein [bacterium]|nr:ABC transporter ATP-binding protein [bacterium]